MNGKRVYDLPTRVFHWIFAGCFLTAFTIANTADDDGAGFSYHMIAGMVMVLAVIGRIVWGIIGSRYARFAQFSLQPVELLNYLKTALIGTTRLWPGHNPASSWAAVIMMLLALGLGISGYLMISSPLGESLEEVHEVLANGFIIVVLLHIAGIAMHTFKHKDPIAKSMLHGRKQHIPDTELPVSSHTVVGLLMLVVSLGVGGYLLGNYDAGNRTLLIAGRSLPLTEHEDDAREHEHH